MSNHWVNLVSVTCLVVALCVGLRACDVCVCVRVMCVCVRACASVLAARTSMSERQKERKHLMALLRHSNR